MKKSGSYLQGAQNITDIGICTEVEEEENNYEDDDDDEDEDDGCLTEITGEPSDSLSSLPLVLRQLFIVFLFLLVFQRI